MLPPVVKQIFELPTYRTIGGRDITPVRIGWESYGTLNADKSNAILINHYFSGTSHAAGRYAGDDPALGYWDDLIGAGKAVDTDRFFVIASDTLVNLNAFDPHVVTTGPASRNPATGRSYGLDFPPVTIGDFVAVQKALVDSLGITKLHAVMGPSMGGLQTFEWAASYPDAMRRIVAVIAAGVVEPWLAAWLDVWASPIKLDPKWRDGAYDLADPPLEGLTQALQTVSLHALHWEWARAQFGSGAAGQVMAESSQACLADIRHPLKVTQVLAAAARAKASSCDANHFLYLVRANQSFVAGQGAAARHGTPTGLQNIRVPTLLLSAPGDQVFPQAWIDATAEALRQAGVAVTQGEVSGPLGHLNGVSLMGSVATQIQAFLSLP